MNARECISADEFLVGFTTVSFKYYKVLLNL